MNYVIRALFAFILIFTLLNVNMNNLRHVIGGVIGLFILLIIENTYSNKTSSID